MRWFEAFQPSPDVRAVLACRYVATAHGRHDLVPDGCMDILWREGRGLVLCGPDTNGWSFEPRHRVAVSGVRFHPGAAADVFAVDASELVDRQPSASELLGDRDGRVLDEQLAAAPDDVTRVEILESFVRRRMHRVSRRDDRTVELAVVVMADPAAAVDRLVELSGVSARQLQRRFARTVGYGPAFLSRIARLQRAARLAARRPDIGLAELAVQAGFVDQAHLAKHCRAIANSTPREFVDGLARTSIAFSLRDLGVGRTGWPSAVA